MNNAFSGYMLIRKKYKYTSEIENYCRRRAREKIPLNNHQISMDPQMNFIWSGKISLSQCDFDLLRLSTEEMNQKLFPRPQGVKKT